MSPFFLGILFLMAFFAVSLFARFECPLTIVADPAVLALIYLTHGELCVFLHREDLWMAVCAFQSLVRMDFSVKYNLAGGPSCEIYRLPGRNSKASPCKRNRND